MIVLPRRRSDVVVTELGTELIIFDTRANTAHQLTGIAAAVWMLCDGTTTVADAAACVGCNADDVMDACAQLSAAGLTQHSASLTRRRALQGGAIVAGGALVSTVVIPRAAAAASTGGGGSSGGGATPVTLTRTGFSTVTIPVGATAVRIELTGGAGGNADVNPEYPTWYGGGGGTVVWDLGAGYVLPAELVLDYDIGTAGTRITGGVSGPAGLHGGSGYNYNGYAAGGGGAASKVTFSGAASGVIIAGAGGGSGNGTAGGPGGATQATGSGSDGKAGTVGQGTSGPLTSVSAGGAFGGAGEAGQDGVFGGFGEGGGTGAGGHAGQAPPDPEDNIGIICGYGGGAGSNSIDPGLTLNGVSPANGATSSGDGLLTITYLT